MYVQRSTYVCPECRIMKMFVESIRLRLISLCLPITRCSTSTQKRQGIDFFWKKPTKTDRLVVNDLGNGGFRQMSYSLQ